MPQTQVETKSVPILEIREMLREVIRMQTRIDPRLITLDARLKQDLGINDDVRACIIRELEWLCDAKAPDSLFSPEVQMFQDIAQCMFESYAKEKAGRIQ